MKTPTTFFFLSRKEALNCSLQNQPWWFRLLSPSTFLSYISLSALCIKHTAKYTHTKNWA